MKISALRVAEFGPFTDGVAIENFSGGFDVLPAGNEAGKSHLFRALRMVLTQKYSSRSQAEVLSFIPSTGGAPLVELDLAVAGRRMRVRKRYAAQPAAVSPLEFTVEATGGFQDFRPRMIGRVGPLAAGQHTLRIMPKQIAKQAACDIRQVRLVPVTPAP